MVRLVATFFGVGLLPAAPGTWGSLVALPLGLVLVLWSGSFGLMLSAGVAFGLGWWATDRYTAGSTDHDPSEVVIDEVVGQWLALVPLSLGIGVFIGDPTIDASINLLIAFGLFRVFDITKPFPVSHFDRQSTAFGVMMDDVVAGAMAATCIALISWVAA